MSGGFKMSQRSLLSLDGVHPLLCSVVKTALDYTKTDFGVIHGVRTLEEQKDLFERGASKTMDSYHLPQSDGYSHAVDLMAYAGKRASWEITLYDDIADAMKAAAQEHGASIRWGGSWTVPDIRDWEGSMEEAMNSYVDLRRSQGRRPFVDGPHFELRSIA
jgi:peptidoglycan L-alanyl-D-glutamate endopeptidase CwlK|tara:strand:+ start:1569 stop:2051 length:483 start_codon:yes stop_codon:yes gene_type:complete